MPEYKVSVREEIGEVLTVTADSPEEAEDKALYVYNNGPVSPERYNIDADVLDGTITCNCGETFDLDDPNWDHHASECDQWMPDLS